MFLFRKSWLALFSCNTRFEIRSFTLLPTLSLWVSSSPINFKSSNESWKLRSSLSPKSVQINQWHEKKVIPGYSIIHIRNIFFTSLISETPCKAGRICKNKYHSFADYMYFYMLPEWNRTIIPAGNNMFKVNKRNTRRRLENTARFLKYV